MYYAKKYSIKLSSTALIGDGCKMESTYEMIVEILVEKMGFVILSEIKDDFAISDYITDSIMFIQFINNIEEELGQELPDDFLLYDILGSAIGLATKIDDFLDPK